MLQPPHCPSKVRSTWKKKRFTLASWIFLWNSKLSYLLLNFCLFSIYLGFFDCLAIKGTLFIFPRDKIKSYSLTQIEAFFLNFFRRKCIFFNKSSWATHSIFLRHCISQKGHHFWLFLPTDAINIQFFSPKKVDLFNLRSRNVSHGDDIKMKTQMVTLVQPRPRLDERFWWRIQNFSGE